MKFSRFQKIRKFTSAKTWKFTLAKFRSLEIFSRVQKMGSSHPPKFRCSLSQIGEVHFAEFRSSEDCCITKHENRKVHFEHKNIEVHIILGSSLRTKRQNNSEVQFKHVKVRNIFRSSLATTGKFIYLHTEIHSPYRSSYLKWKFTLTMLRSVWKFRCREGEVQIVQMRR
jgi:hypothetical protein